MSKQKATKQPKSGGVCFAYLRVSTDQQDVDNQKHGILEYVNKNNLGKVVFVEDTASGKIGWKERKLGELLTETATKGDTVLFAEFSRMGRSALQVLEVMKYGIENGINLHITKENIILADNIQSTIYATVLGLAGEIERDFIKKRTSESIANKRQQIAEKGYFINRYGKKVTNLGRPKGKAQSTKLDEKEEEIKGYLKKGINKRAIAKLVDVAPSTLYDWLKRKKIKL